MTTLHTTPERKLQCIYRDESLMLFTVLIIQIGNDDITYYTRTQITVYFSFLTTNYLAHFFFVKI